MEIIGGRSTIHACRIGALLISTAGTAALWAGSVTRAAAQSLSTEDTLAEVTVTATRREEDIQKVPINITAYNEAQMDDLGIKNMDDIARLTPDVQYTHTSGASGNNSSDIAIRGVFSDVGAPTTGIYIDDTPIQMRNIGYWNANAFPQIFDLERVEVLRGPQGTLFGAGAEGGALRFITPEPSLVKDSGYFRAELAETVSGTPSYEAGGALGGPIIDNELGFRVSVWGRHDGGYIDRVSPDTGTTVGAETNYQDSGAGKAALALVPVENLKITAGVFYQDIYSHDRDQYWSNISDATSNEFDQAARVKQPTQDELVLPSLKIQYDLGAVSIISDTSYFYHRDYASLDYTTYFGGIFDGDPLQFLPGDQPSQAFETNRQNGFVEELRAQSTAKDALIDWTVGLFYSDNTQKDQDLTTDGQLVYTSELGNTLSFVENTAETDRQYAAYGDIDVNLTKQLKLTGGLRVSDTQLSFFQTSSFNGSTLPNAAGNQSNTPVTPKFVISYQLDPNNYLYASAAKGFREGGVNGAVASSICATDLAALGLTNTPASFSPDSLWSYELGAKDNLLDGHLILDSSFYVIKWNNIQQSIRLPSCGFAFVDNLGSASGIGGDVSARVRLSDALSAGVSAGHTQLTYDQTILEGANAILVNKGDEIGGPQFNLAAFAMLKFPLGAHNAFYRIDYTYHNHTPAVDAAVFSYDPTLPDLPAARFLSMRLGMYVGGWELSLFGNNLTKEEVPIAISHDIPGVIPYYLQSYRPLTVGITGAYHF
jgi:outer membrane receptor protein involved in Fe transport